MGDDMERHFGPGSPNHWYRSWPARFDPISSGCPHLSREVRVFSAAVVPKANRVFCRCGHVAPPLSSENSRIHTGQDDTPFEKKVPQTVSHPGRARPASSPVPTGPNRGLDCGHVAGITGHGQYACGAAGHIWSYQHCLACFVLSAGVGCGWDSCQWLLTQFSTARLG